MSTDGGASWSTLAELDELNAAELLPVAGTTGAVYVLTTASRRPLAVAESSRRLNVQQSAERSASGLSGTQLLGWILAGNASAALVILAFGEFKGGARRLQPGPRERRGGEPRFHPSSWVHCKPADGTPSTRACPGLPGVGPLH